MTRNQDIALCLLKILKPIDGVRVEYSTQTDTTTFTLYYSYKDPMLTIINPSDSNEKAISKYNEALRLIEERRNEVMQNLDFQEEMKAEMLREAELNSLQGEA